MQIEFNIMISILKHKDSKYSAKKYVLSDVKSDDCVTIRNSSKIITFAPRKKFC